MNKHTPGPWVVFQPNASQPSRVSVSTTDGGINLYSAPLTAETQANAHLIAAAPDLLHELYLLLTQICKCWENGGRCHRCTGARSAIAKATGGENE